MNFKWIGAILIVCGCGGVGFALANTYRREERELRSLAAAMDYMACELQYRLTPLPDLCRMAGRESKGCVGTVLTRLATELECRVSPDVETCVHTALKLSGPVSERVQEAFVILGTSLGRFDLDGQLKGLEAVRSFCRRELETLSAGRDNRLRSYQTLGICAGAALAILLV